MLTRKSVEAPALFYWLLFIFVAIPVVELVVLGWLHDTSGLVFTVALILATGFAGAALARRQGLLAWRRIHESLAAGQTPAAEVLDAVLILVAGAVLITPGLLTDCVGFLLLIPVTRRFVAKWLGVWFRRRTVAQFTVQSMSADRDFPVNTSSGPIIDAEFERVPDDRPAGDE